jgi:hypothetical protein
MSFILPALVFGFFGGWLTLSGLGRFGQLKAVSGSVRTLSGALIAALGAGSALLGFNFVTYQRLTNERPAAMISFVQTAPQRYTASLEIPDEEPRTLIVNGDEWRLDARFIKWHPFANIGGLDAYYRLDRITGRYRDTGQEVSEPRSVYAVSENPGLDIWKLARDKRFARLKALDAYYGNSVYAPMLDGARFEVFATQNGLIVRPNNDAAKAALEGWE